ncbi:putative endo-1,3(4)-beta-glucanase [Colletotrichum sidae]|uniref:Putative endo-1,3(4)-beta-glucanase n=1 Tax=Colletotrichum sidae TaxID=1347389 RepID=A0A4V3I351_9PEZI|nr:putative endo-1,3(4)-beta-glucanase [Colletotrichum sidae]
MAPSFLSTLSSALLLTCTVSATRSYQLVDNYDSTNFLDKFGFFVSDHTTGNYNDVDPTGGYVSYKSAEEAQALGLLKTVNSELYLGVDSTSKLDAAGTGRSSVRIESKSRYKKGLFVTDFSHFPKPTCGAWPAFWTVGNPWPAAGEIDIVETWNEDNVNKVVIHTDSNVGECRIDGAGMTGQVSKPNCANFAPGQSDNEGCAGLDSAAPFGSPEGGVYAMEWTDTAIRVWGFTHANVPADIATNPNPETWGTPSFTTSVCEADKVFGEAKMVMNIDFCGVAGNDGIWDQGGCQAKTGGATCKEWVANNPQAFADVYFQLKSVKIYQLKDGEASVSTSPTQVAPTSAAASSAVSTDVAGPSTAVAPEKPVETVPVQSAETDAVEPTATASEAPIETPAEELTTRLATSTIYETNIKTITSCAPTVTNCPAKETPVIVTEVVPLTTTICPVVDVPTSMTVSKTEVRTITSCPPAVTNCPVGSKTTITTHEVVHTTAAIPVESYTPTEPAEGNKPVTTEKPVADITTAITTYKTNIVTITSCPPSVTNCPVGKVSTIVTSEIVPITTEGEKPIPVATDAPGAPALQTTYKTNIVTITSCPPTVPDCPIGKETTIVTSEVITPTAGTPTTPTDIAQNPPVPGAETTPEALGGDKPTAPVTPGVGTPVTTAPATGATTSAEKPVAETPAVDTAMPTTLVVAPSVPSNGTLTTARFPAGTGVPCIGSACPATTTGPVQAGAGKVTSGVFALVAALVVFVI